MLILIKLKIEIIAKKEKTTIRQFKMIGFLQKMTIVWNKKLF